MSAKSDCDWILPRPSALPMGIPPRGLSRVQSAEYVGVSPTKFDQMVADGRMPKPKRIDGRVVCPKDKGWVLLSS